ncbi:MAG: hypothetical protein P1U89_21335 [Verrucomicrobiales bacterium]|nr:hypothetical protein [Verrucomicrobiales bacterium]
MNVLSMFDQVFGDWLNVENKRNVLAIFVIVKFFAVVGFVSFLVWTIRKNAAKQCPDTANLLDELDHETDEPGRHEDNKEEWQKNPDWWKE